MEDQILSAAKGKPVLIFISSVQGQFAGQGSNLITNASHDEIPFHFYFA